MWPETIKLRELLECINRCSAASVAVKPGDVAALATLHGDLEQALDLFSGKADGKPGAEAPILDSIERIANLVEGAVLSDAGERIGGDLR